jgi:hypothetical protein
MGKVISLIKKLREMSNHHLLARFKQIARAQAVREYLAAKEDTMLTMEVNLASEEIISRMSNGNQVRIVPDTTEEEVEILT